MRSLSAHQTRLLDLLLSRFERGISGRKPSVTVTAERFPEYFEDSRPAQVRHWEEESLALELLGWIEIDRGRGADAHRIARVRLNTARSGEIGQALGRMSAPDFQLAMEGLIDFNLKQTRDGAHGWLRAFLESERERWRVAGAPAAHSRTDELEDARLVYSSLLRLAANSERLTWRQFSVAHFGDSKKLLSLKPRICRILASHGLSQESVEADESAVLSHFGIDLKAGVTLMKGPARLAFAKTALKIDARQWQPFLALPEEMLSDSRLDASEAEAVLTIENEESFHAFARAAGPPGWLVVYLGGFPSRQKLRFLASLVAEGLTFRHWGDLDCGGLEIFLYLERELGLSISPLGMEPKRLRQLERSCQFLSAKELSRLRRIQGELRPGHSLAPLVAEMLSTGLKLEQEAVLDPLLLP